MKKILLLLSMMVFMVACGGGSKGGEVTINLRTEPSSIDPQITTDVAGGTVDELVMEGLLRKDKNGKSVAGLAEKWESTPDGLKWTFHLRDGLKWSNGDPITAKDFRAGWLRALDPATGSGNANLLFPIKNGEAFNSKKVSADEVGIKVVDDKTLEVTLEAPTPYFDDLVTFKAYMPLDEKYLLNSFEEKIKDDDETVRNFIYVLLICRYLFDCYVIKSNAIRTGEENWSLWAVRPNGSSYYYKNTFGNNTDESKNDEELDNSDDTKTVVMLLSMFHVSNPSRI